MNGPSLQSSLDALYSVFYAPKPRKIDGCPCCVDRKNICTLVREGLTELTPDDLAPYAASVFLTVGSLRDFKYFLPRILEISASDGSWYPTKEIVLKKLKLAQWETWSVTERDAIHRFLLAWFNAEVERETPNGSEIDALICGLALAGEDVAPFLARMLENPAALSAFYDVNSNTLFRKRKLSNAFWSDDKAAALPIISFLQSSAVQSKLLPS